MFKIAVFVGLFLLGVNGAEEKKKRSLISSPGEFGGYGSELATYGLGFGVYYDLGLENLGAVFGRYGIGFSGYDFGAGSLGFGGSVLVGSSFCTPAATVTQKQKTIPASVTHPVPVTVKKAQPLPVPRPVPLEVHKPANVSAPHSESADVPKSYPVSVTRPVLVPETRKVPVSVKKPYQVQVPEPGPVIRKVPATVSEPHVVPVPLPVAHTIIAHPGADVKFGSFGDTLGLGPFGLFKDVELRGHGFPGSLELFGLCEPAW